MDASSMPQTEEEWKEKLGPEAYHVLREKGTEAPFSGKLLHEKRDDMYHCAALQALSAHRIFHFVFDS